MANEQCPHGDWLPCEDCIWAAEKPLKDRVRELKKTLLIARQYVYGSPDANADLAAIDAVLGGELYQDSQSQSKGGE